MSPLISTRAGVGVYAYGRNGAAAPNAPTNVVVSITGAQSISVSYTAPADNGAPINGYIATISPDIGTTMTLTSAATANPLTYTTSTVTFGQNLPYTLLLQAVNAAGKSLATTTTSFIPNALATVTGGTISEDTTYTYRLYSGTNTLTIDNGPLNCDLLLVAGGGAGMNGQYVSTPFQNFLIGGGGGAGGVKAVTNQTLSIGSNTVVVGAGGVANGGGAASAWKGGDTFVQNASSAAISPIAHGGGSSETSKANVDGGSGAGATGLNTAGAFLNIPAGTGTAGEGNNGGSFSGAYNGTTGGGGGAGAAGAIPAGGAGVNYASWNSLVGYVGGGGGGGSWNGPSSGGTGGGGAGGNSGGSPGSANTGGGGGGTSGNSGGSAFYGANGGSGIAIIRYPKANATRYPAVSGGTLTSDATYYYRTFTSNGTLTVANFSLTADILVVGGGGGGGAGNALNMSGQSAATYQAGYGGGAGGGGGAVAATSAATAVTPGAYAITVGANGAGASVNNNSFAPSPYNTISWTQATAGTSSSFATLFSAAGGAASSSYGFSVNAGASSGNSYAGGAASTNYSGGGGGAGGAGKAAGNTGFLGGVGYTSSITGTSLVYGYGGNAPNSATAAGTNDSGYGRGGGGGYISSPDVYGDIFSFGGYGSPGVVIVRYTRASVGG